LYHNRRHADITPFRVQFATREVGTLARRELDPHSILAADPPGPCHDKKELPKSSRVLTYLATRLKPNAVDVSLAMPVSQADAGGADALEMLDRLGMLLREVDNFHAFLPCIALRCLAYQILDDIV
jgi:hypothetical protein